MSTPIQFWKLYKSNIPTSSVGDNIYFGLSEEGTGSIWVTDNQGKNVKVGQNYDSELESVNNQINVLKEEIEITKTITTVANTWTDVGISISDIVSKNGLYAIFVHETINKLSYFGLWSGVMSMYPHTTNSEYSCEIPLHCSCHAMYNATVVKFRVANTIGSISPNAHIEIYTDCSIETTMMFKFKKILEV